MKQQTEQPNYQSVQFCGELPASELSSPLGVAPDRGFPGHFVSQDSRKRATDKEIAAALERACIWCRSRLRDRGVFNSDDAVQQAALILFGRDRENILSPCDSFVFRAVMNAGISLNRKEDTGIRGGKLRVPFDGHDSLWKACEGEADLALLERVNSKLITYDRSALTPRQRVCLDVMILWYPDTPPKDGIIPYLNKEEFLLFLPEDKNHEIFIEQDAETVRNYVRRAVEKSLCGLRQILATHRSQWT